MTTDTLISLIQLGLHGTSNSKVQIATRVSWSEVLKMASMQGVSAICLDGMQQLTEQPALDKALKLQWIGGVLKQEQAWQQQWRMAQQLAALYAANGIGTYVMKGFSLSRLYPQPAHRPCTDMDCFLLAQDGLCLWCRQRHCSAQRAEGGLRILQTLQNIVARADGGKPPIPVARERQRQGQKI